MQRSLHCVHAQPDQPVHDTGSLGTVYMPLLSDWSGRNTQIIVSRDPRICRIALTPGYM